MVEDDNVDGFGDGAGGTDGFGGKKRVWLPFIVENGGGEGKFSREIYSPISIEVVMVRRVTDGWKEEIYINMDTTINYIN